MRFASVPALWALPAMVSAVPSANADNGSGGLLSSLGLTNNHGGSGSLLSALDQTANNGSRARQQGSNPQSASSILSLLNGDNLPKNAAEVGSVEDALDKISRAHPDNNTQGGGVSLVDFVSDLLTGGVIPLNLVSLLDGYADMDLNSPHNKNPDPPRSLYPSEPPDAPYSIPEATLRAAIHIPDSFSYGKNGKKPILMVPGTGAPAGSTYHFTFGRLGDALPSADPVWLNIPGSTLGDAQKNAEYVAYAIHYISAVSADSHVAAISWSQGGLDTQWALKYWPSTRDLVDDFIPMSPDFHGTVIREVLCPLLEPLVCDPSVWQQGWDTEFIHTLRADDGDSAYVPTTSVYSTFDEIVEPQSGPDASAILADSRGVGVSNNHLQSLCPGQVAGGVYTHEGVLYNAVAWALAVDALSHDGPGDPQRIDLDHACALPVAPQLRVDDVLGTEGVLLISLVNFLVYLPKLPGEPPIAAYAR